MSSRHILPDYILSHFAQAAQCGTDGCKHGSLEVFCPMVRRKGAIVELVYPCKCSCSRRGHFIVGLNELLLGYLLTQVACIKASGRRSKSVMNIYPRSSDLVQKLLDKFDVVVTQCAEAKMATPTEADQKKFEFTDTEWRDFLHRLGFEPTAEESD